MWSGDAILSVLRNYRQICAEKEIIQATIQQMLDQQKDSVVPDKLQKLLLEYEKKDHIVKGCLNLLTTEERFVVLDKWSFRTDTETYSSKGSQSYNELP